MSIILKNNTKRPIQFINGKLNVTLDPGKNTKVESLTLQTKTLISEGILTLSMTEPAK